MYRIVASDLDGTLLNHEHRLSAFTKQVLQALRKRHIHFIFATGRHHIDVAQMRENMEIDAYTITSNGARVHNSQGELILSRSIDASLAPAIAQMAVDDPLIYTHIYRGDEWLINREDSFSLSYFEESDFCYQIFNPYDFPTSDIAKIYFTTAGEQDQYAHLVKLKDKLQQRFGNNISVAFSTLNCLEVMGKGVSKGTALEFVAKQLGCDLSETIAFGDGMNDYEMLSMAGKGCIMQNAPQMLKAVLPDLEVIGLNSEDAVPHYLQKLFLNESDE
ncbi:Cof-type HAD-IIB family hydrolase [Utexia brackfieldae]|uniref:Cof-type HAD-IIB family hydrolase n=1 Tax=Utexia brackfieldae TaxID=3074108 RepID=UPI00370DB312